MNTIKRLLITAIVATSVLGLVPPAKAATFEGCRSHTTAQFRFLPAPSLIGDNAIRCRATWPDPAPNSGRGAPAEVFVIPPGATDILAFKYTDASYGSTGDTPQVGRLWSWVIFSPGVGTRSGVRTEFASPDLNVGLNPVTRVDTEVVPLDPTTSGQRSVTIKFFGAGHEYKAEYGTPYVCCTP